MSRPSVARDCVDVDLLHEFPKRILLGMEEYLYFQKVTYENLPDYCMECRKLGHATINCRHGNVKAASATATIEELRAKVVNQSTTGMKQSVPKKVGISLQTKPPPPEPVWKMKTLQEKATVQNTKQQTEGSSSGLTTKEKKDVPTDIGSLSPLVQQEKRLISKEQDQIDDKEEEHVHSKGNLTKEVESESETELVLDDARNELHSNYLLREDETKDDGDIGMNESAVEDMRLVVFDGEEIKKKRGRPRGSKTGVKVQGTETRRSTRLQGDSPQKFLNE
ncbi:OLC1v1036022C1 [Oldenlandia corymbosa var. corymbosa]|uniref:OLC1v1036022C1 n=1 Tax=Oldenlandia corymbosa var. corymbosa TaxID=529605 RepID=A0AAV1CXS7_OLDCO|nr:OLC1v1036022C1 [Oldenlandia corymbosa var. corymbosa]